MNYMHTLEGMRQEHGTKKKYIYVFKSSKKTFVCFKIN